MHDCHLAYSICVICARTRLLGRAPIVAQRARVLFGRLAGCDDARLAPLLELVGAALREVVQAGFSPATGARTSYSNM